jgi:hypothetical protein
VNDRELKHVAVFADGHDLIYEGGGNGNDTDQVIEG